MDYQFPKRIIEEGAETKIDKINNTCRRTILGTLKVVLRDEYQEVLKDPIKNNVTKVRCRNWKGSGKVSYQDITSLESNFDKGELFPFISSTGSLDATDNAEFFREDEKNDERVNRIVALISAKQDWKQFTWEVETLPPNIELSDAEEDVEVENVTETPVEEPTVVEEEPGVVTKRGKRKLIDPGVESRKKQLLCKRAAEHNSVVSGDMKTFIEGLFNSSFNSFKELLQKDIQERFDKVDNEMAQLKATVSQITGPSVFVGRDLASEIPCPSATLGKEQEKSSQSPGPSGAKGKGKGKASVSVDPPPLRRSPRPEFKTDDDDMFDFLKNLSQSSNYVDKGTQESLQDAVGNLSQASHVKGFDPSQKIKDDEPAEWITPLSSFKPPNWKPPTLKDEELLEDRVHDIDHSLVFVPEDAWAKIIEWSSTSKELKIGPSMLTSVLAARVMGPTEWLLNHEIDAMMYLFTERTTLRRWEPTKVAFMSCMFSNQMKTSFEEFRKDKKKFKVSELLHRYGIEVFDCEGLKYNKEVEPFAILIPRIVKCVHSSKSRQQLTVKQYTVSYAPMPYLLNKSSSDCGVYALKHIECHLLGLDFSLVNDSNIREARQKIVYDLWEAANDPELILRMAQYIPPKLITNPLVELD
ncbi:hypothetical protein YC2023_002854 [Brassica napus]